MKKVVFSLFFFSFMIIGAQAQSCAKTCSKSASAGTSCHAKAPAAAFSGDTDNSTAAAKLASLDATIETRTDPITGGVFYVRKETSSADGSVSYVDVTYDATSNTFVNVSPMKAAGCGSNATGVSSKPGCAGSAASGKSCCAGKGKAAEKVKS